MLRYWPFSAGLTGSLLVAYWAALFESLHYRYVSVTAAKIGKRNFIALDSRRLKKKSVLFFQ